MSNKLLQFNIGETFYLFGYHIKQTKCHVVCKIENEGNTFIIYKWYGKHKQWWHYEIEYMWVLKDKLKSYTGVAA